jgi:hypothetical protein
MEPTPWNRLLVVKLVAPHGQKMHCFFWNLKVHHRVHNSPPLVTGALSPASSVRTFTHCSLKAQLNIIRLSIVLMHTYIPRKITARDFRLERRMVNKRL